MTSRLERAPLTEEDRAIRGHLCRRLGRVLGCSLPGYYMVIDAQLVDRRDADLMLRLMEMAAPLRADLGGTKAVAHRMVSGQLCSDTVWIEFKGRRMPVFLA